MLELSTAILDREFGRETMRRGREYAATGRIVDFHVDLEDGRVIVRGSVAGSAPTPYAVVVRIEQMHRGLEIWSSCTCPVRIYCKHAAAVLLHSQSHGPVARAAWSGQLEETLSALEKDTVASTARARLGLRFEVAIANYRWSEQTLRSIGVRPVQVGKLGRWIVSGCNWSEIPGLAYDPSFDSAQVDALSRMALTLGTSYGGVPDLGSAGPMFWPALRQLLDSGVELVAGGGVSQITLRELPVALSADLSEITSGLQVDLVVGDDAQTWPVGDVELIGARPHGVVILEEQAERDRRGASLFEMTLAPLRRRLPESVRHLVRKSPTLSIPQDGRDEFEDDFLPRLRRQLPTTSRDGSVRLAEEKPPVLQLELDWTVSGSVRASGFWAYPRGSGVRRFGIDTADGIAVVRNEDVEAEVLRALELAAPARDLLCDTHGRLRGQTRLSGDNLLTFVADVLPGLRDHPGLELVDVGEPVDYRMAEGDLEITFGVAEPDPEAQPEHTDWLDLEVLVRIDGHEIPLGMILTALTRKKEMIVLHSGLHVRTDHPALERLAELVAAAKELAEQPDGRVRVGRTDVGLWGDVDELGVVDAEALAWVRSARALKDFEGLPEVDTSRLASDLRHYQLQGAQWLTFLWQAGLGGILADDMGLGKTLQALAVINHARARGSGPFLVVAPTSVVSNWALEAARHAPELSVGVVSSTKSRRDKSIADLAGGCDVVVTSYTLLRLEAAEYAEQRWGGLVLDEAQQIKNHRSRAYRAVRDIDAPFRVALTGTPFENRLMELWSLLSVVAPGLYPSPQRFREVVVRPIERGDQQTLDRLRRRIRPFLLRRTKEVVAPEMPPKQEQVLEVTLGSRHRSIYDTHLQRERQAVLGLVEDFDRNRVAIFRSLTRMRQLSLDPALVDDDYDKVGSAKIEVLVEQLTQLAGEGHRALVFSQFTSFLGRVRTQLEAAGITTCYLDGRTRNRAKVIEEFRGGTAPAFLISLKAGGTGLTLTEADYVFVLDPWWNPAVESQAVDRVHRIGQQRSVMVYRLVAADTIEDKVMALKERKARLFAQVIEGDGAAAAAIEADDVRALFED